MQVKENKKSGTWSLLNLSDDEVFAMYRVLEAANSLCFREKDEDGDWYSGEGFICTVSDEERKCISNICKKLTGE
jgi:hypothetical protein